MYLWASDQLTCKNIRGCKLWRATEPLSKDRLSWARETPGGHNNVNSGYTLIYSTANLSCR